MRILASSTFFAILCASLIATVTSAQPSAHALTKPNATLTRALIMIHGAGRNADHYFETATAAGFPAGALEHTIILSPRLIATPDKPEVNEVVWPNGNVSWRAGGFSTSNPTINSFDFVDEMVHKLADKKVFPKLSQIVIAGHSAGGQVVTRYAMVNNVHDTKGVKITYVIANPSSSAWPSDVRPLPTGDSDPVDAYKESLGKEGESVHTNFTYGRSTRPKRRRTISGRQGSTVSPATRPA